MDDFTFEQQFRSHLTNMLRNPSLYPRDIKRNALTDYDELWHVSCVIESYFVSCIVYSDNYGMKIYLDSYSLYALVINPVLEEFKQAAKDIARIGHS